MNEQDAPVAGDCDEPGLIDLRRRLLVALACTTPLVAVEIATLSGLQADSAGRSQLPWLQLLLATPVVLWSAWPLLQRAWRSISHRSPDRFTLIGLGVLVVYGCSALTSAALIVTLVLLGQLAELRAWQHSRAALRTLPPRIVQAVAEAQGSRAPLQEFANRVAAWLALAVVAVAAVAAAGWWAFGPEPRLAHALQVAASTLLIASPGALVLAAPLSMALAMGRGAQAGVLLRSAAALERLKDVDTVVFARTGTLTVGRPEVVSVIPVDGIAEAELLRLAASLEQGNGHPIAAAIVATAEGRGLRLGRSHGLRAVPGKGVVGVVQSRKVAVGNASLMAEAGIDSDLLEPEARRLRALGQTVVFVALDGVPVGLLGVADPLKPEAWEVVRQLEAVGIRIVVLSGDHAESVRAVAAQLGILDVAAGIRSEAAATYISGLRAAGHEVAMVGAGSPDAPALAAADVGIALGDGIAIVQQATSVTLLNGDLQGVVRALHLGEATLRNVGQNLLLAVGYNALGIGLAAGALYPLAGRLLSPLFASIAMSISLACIIGNALRLRSARV